jgi:hypothetical protein
MISGTAGAMVLWEAVHPIAARSHSEVTWTALRHLAEMGPAEPPTPPPLLAGA